MARDRGYPFNTSDWSRICNESGGCMHNKNENGVSPDGTFNGLFAMPGLALVRPVTTAGADAGSGRYSFLNPALACGRWTPVQLTAAQMDPTQGGSATAPANGRVCEVNSTAAYGMLQPEVERYGLSTRFTANMGEDHQLYVQGNYYRTDTLATQSPWPFRDRPTSPRGTALVYNVIAPVYVCPTGVGTLNGVNTGCTAANGTLNPNNPYAAASANVRFPLGYTSEFDNTRRSSLTAGATFRF